MAMIPRIQESCWTTAAGIDGCL